MTKVVIAGGTGALGRRISDDLADRGYDVVVLTRSPKPGRHRQVQWDGVTVGDWARELDGASVINLAGELVDRRPTPANIALLTNSRVDPTRALVEASKLLAHPVPAWIQASTLAIYGDAGEARLDEDSPPADGPPQMTDVAKDWEAAVEGANTSRVVILRTSVVLEKGTPALERLLLLVRLGLGGRVASGRQWTSWIHIDDWLSIVRWALEPVSAASGVVIATAPDPVRNSELMAGLRKHLHRPPAPPTPAFMVRFGAFLLRSDAALGLTGRHAVSKVLTDNGFPFTYPRFDSALDDLLGN
ncbi:MULTISPECIES: TIGR01777 family oxidoreductase [Rhodococcus]|uniref:TIGR01777 family oxidoreductase n=1 Tax=Rhodococcus qingshengii JCM 15477 TaxID=1303681 RepID=A0AB38R663_RHOSG|nr:MULTISPECIES: TIGR01777 family oxidoreductase [Rhodococcus]UPU40363.1 TIGR01777 family oxidoreductase [Rhodococcus qingshengii JCM 15477]